MVQVLKDKEEWDKCHAEAGDKAVIVDFTASWCGPCKFIGPVFEKLAEENPSVVFVKVDVDENERANGDTEANFPWSNRLVIAALAVAESCGISAMPTFQVYKNGKKVEEFSGADPEKLKALIENYK